MIFSLDSLVIIDDGLQPQPRSCPTLQSPQGFFVLSLSWFFRVKVHGRKQVLSELNHHDQMPGLGINYQYLCQDDVSNRDYTWDWSSVKNMYQRVPQSVSSSNWALVKHGWAATLILYKPCCAAVPVGIPSRSSFERNDCSLLSAPCCRRTIKMLSHIPFIEIEFTFHKFTFTKCTVWYFLVSSGFASIISVSF